MYVITADGWTKKYSGDMNELYYGQYADEKKADEAKRAAAEAAAPKLAAAAGASASAGAAADSKMEDK